MYIPESLVTIAGPIVVCPVYRDSIFHKHESESTMNKSALHLGLGVLIGIGLIAGVAAANAPQDLPACATEDSDNCYWDAKLMGDGTGRSFDAIDGKVYYWDEVEPVVPPVEQPAVIATDPAPVPTFTPAPKPEPKPSVAPKPTTVDPNQKTTWDTGTLECGINAKPAIDQDQYGNWWAYCEPALIGD